MTGLIVLVLIVAVIALAVTVARQRQRTPPPVVDPLRRDSRGIDPRQLKVGDVVNHDGHDYLVRGSLTFEEGGYEWQEHFLDDTEGRRWLSVEDDEELELIMWHRVDAPELEPGAPRLTFGGIEYSLVERGNANYTASGATGTAPSGSAAYADYAAEDKRLGFEQFVGERWEVSIGEVLNERSLDIYPAPPQ